MFISAISSSSITVIKDVGGVCVSQSYSIGDMISSNNLSDLANVVQARSNLGLGTLATQSATITDYLTVSSAAASYQSTITTGTTAQYFKGDLSLGTFPTTTASFASSTNKNFVTDAQLVVIGNTSGTNTGDQNLAAYLTTASAALTYQPLDSDLTTLAGLTATTDNFIVSVSSAWASRTAAQVKVTLSINNLDNTSDANKPVSTATQTALNLKANLISPSFTTPALGTPSSGTLTNCTFPTLNQNTTGTAAALTTARTINTVSFDGTANIVITAAAGTLTGATLASGITASSLTSFGASIVLGTPASGNLANCTFPTLNQNTSGTAANLSGTPALPNGTTATSQSQADNSTKIATTSYVDTGLALKANLTSPILVTPVIGVATGTSLAVTGVITSSGGGIGYVAGAGGTAVQGTSRVTTVVLNKLCGTFTMFSAAQASQALVTFTLTNSFIAANDFVLVQHISATNGGAWSISVVAGAGSCTINIRNVTAASITEATPLRITVIKAAVT